MTHYSHIPLVRILLPLLAGIIAFSYLEYFLNLPIIVAVLCVFLMSGILINKYILAVFQLRFYYGINVMLFLAFAGYVLAQSRYALQKPAHFSQYQWEEAMLRIRLIEPVAEKTNSFQVIAKAMHVISDDSLKKVDGKIIVWLEKDEQAQNLKYGDIILLENYYQLVKEPQNPNAFNYKQFLSRQNIFHQTYRRKGEWHFTGESKGNMLVKTAHQMRQKALETLEANNITGKDFAVASALLLGYRDYLDEDLQREFAGAGAMHILCVSGLHVGIVFLALNLVFGFLTQWPGGKYLKTVLIILLIWFYAAITGFSPSVMRASTMFSFLAIGQTFSRSTNIYNTLAASALILVVLDPFIISRIGFQLSYIAVISIVTLQPLFYRQLYFKNKILDGAWGIITVSLAAQLGTGPLALYYFNQFPNYFVLTNLVVIPLTGIIIKGGLLLFFTAPVAFISQYVGLILSWIILFLHSSVRIIERLPWSTSNNLVITFHDQILIFVLIALLSLFWMKKQKAVIYPILTCLLLLSISFSQRSIAKQYRKQLVVYHVPNATALDIISNGECFFYACENVLQNPSAIDFNIHDNRLKTGVGKLEPILLEKDSIYSQHIYKKSDFINIDGYTIKLINRESSIPSQQLFPDTLSHIILSKNPRVNIHEIIQAFPARTIIFDNSNTLRYHRQWAEECDSLGIDCWSVALQGAYVYNFE